MDARSRVIQTLKVMIAAEIELTALELRLGRTPTLARWVNRAKEINLERATDDPL